MDNHAVTSMSRKQRKAVGRRRGRVFLAVGFSISALLIGAITAYAITSRLHSNPRATRVGAADGSEDSVKTTNLNVLLVGIDERANDKGRADTIMILNFDTAAKSLRLMSIPRDTAAELPKHGRQKINAAYAYGGVDLLRQAVTELTGVRLTNYVRVDFAGFEGIVDALGGVSIDVPKQIRYEDPEQDLYIHFEPGVQKMNGSKALEYVRYRDELLADIGRIERQREFLKAVADQICTPSTLPKLPALVSETRRHVKTDIPLGKQLSLATALWQAFGNGMEMSTLPGRAAYLDGVSYYVMDGDYARKATASWND